MGSWGSARRLPRCAGVRVEDFAASAVDCQGFGWRRFVEGFCLEGVQVSGIGGGG